MSMTTQYAAVEPDATAVAALKGATVLEFGAPWCSFCQRAQPFIAAAFDNAAPFTHIKIEDGRGRPLGRAFKVKLWPTLVFLRDGHELARHVRPADADMLREALARITVAESSSPGS